MWVRIPPPVQIINNMKEENNYEEEMPYEIDYDFMVPLQVKKSYTVKARIKSVEKHIPRIFFD